MNLKTKIFISFFTIVTFFGGQKVKAASVTCEAIGSGKCYYIDQVNGNDDTNNGSFVAPWKSFKNIVTYYGTPGYNGSTTKPSTWVNLQPGDFVYVFNGIYNDVYNYSGTMAVITWRTKNGTSNAQFHLKAYPGQTPIIDPQGQGLGIYLFQSSWWDIEGIEIRNASFVGFDVAEVQNLIVKNMKIHDTDGTDNSNMSGFRVGSSTNVELAESELYDNYDRTNADTNGQATENSSDVVFFTGANVSVHDNLIYQTLPITDSKSGTCLKYKHAQSDPNGYFNVYNNIFRQCKFYSIGSGTQNSYVHNNIMINGGGINSKDFGGITHQVNQTFANNTFYNSGGFYMGLPDKVAVPSSSDPQNIIFQNNIVYDSRNYNQDSGIADIATYGSDGNYLQLTPELHFQNNCYYNPLRSLQFNLFAASGSYGSSGGQYSFSAWKGLGFGYDSNSINANPQFIDATLENFHLQIDSPCNGMGAYAQNQLQTYNILDFVALISKWLYIGESSSDINADNITNAKDLGIIMSKWN